MTEQTEVKLNLYQKIVEVRKSIDNFTKDQASYNYKYVSGTQVLSKIRIKMDELGLLLFPSIVSQSHEIYPYKDKYNKDKQDFLVFGDMNYQWINADKPDEILNVPWKYTGQQDDISKAYGSGLTYAERYFLLKFFGVPTDEDDPDKKGSKKEDSNYPPKTPPKENQTSITGKEVGELKTKVLEFAKLRGKTDTDVYQALNITDITKLTSKEAKEFITKLNGWITSAKKEIAKKDKVGA